MNIDMNEVQAARLAIEKQLNKLKSRDDNIVIDNTNSPVILTNVDISGDIVISKVNVTHKNNS